MMACRKTLTKGALGTVAAGAMVFAFTSPAIADDFDDRNRDRGDGISAGEIIAGAVVIGGIAALAGAFDNDRDDRRVRDRRFRGYDAGFDRGFRGGSRRAVERCVRTAERQARRFGGYRFADVTQIRDVDRTRFGFRIRGRMQVEGARWNRGRDFDRGRFTCFVERGDRPQIEFRGIRGLR
ncbi:MAG: hypothetical protein WA918_05470 [Erythrobacter sp.]